jgi:hypothetical protein
LHHKRRNDIIITRNLRIVRYFGISIHIDDPEPTHIIQTPMPYYFVLAGNVSKSSTDHLQFSKEHAIEVTHVMYLLPVKGVLYFGGIPLTESERYDQQCHGKLNRGA